MISPEKFEWKKHVVGCMNSTEFCCIATVDEGIGTWSNPVYFAWDDSLNIYFISQPHSRHMQNISKDGRIAVSIYSTKPSTFDDVVGIQLDGDAKILTDREEVERAYAAYYGRKYPKTRRNPKGKDEDAYIDNPSWIFVKITPRNMYYFDTRFFDEERQRVPLFETFKESE